ncbi:MAG: tRNA (N6-isopentenyl adenosine(37)-C2)-methylthiotransferase MiaB [Nannocystaceae bacterium]|nr:tRNA (N6-isopentenyl adenosine(37)-C2)-methylthiotransferase MiaB [Nannocystaceae bacterium]
MPPPMTQLVRIRPMRRDSDAGAPATVDATEAGAGRVYLETFGCQMNEADSALIAGQLGHAGYERVEDPAQADVILINTCAIREKAEDRVWGRTSQLLQHARTNPALVIGITGCMAEHLRDKVAARAPYIRLVAGPDSYRGIAGLVARARAGERVVDVKLDRSETYEGLDGVPDDDGVSGQVTIQRGCDKFCSFCVVPYTRGRERAVPAPEVLRAVRRLAEAGYREVVLLGQTVNSYRDGDIDFATLLRAVATVDGIARVRFTSPYPRDMSDALIEVMASEPTIMPQLHLPLQSGADAVLARMGRGYGRDEYLALVERLRAAIPGLALSTDLMVGFCGETEDDHAQTLSLMREVRFDSAFMFRYSDRGVTQAARKLVDDVDDETKGRRLREVIELQEQHTRASHDAQVGRRVPVLVGALARRGDRLLGRTPQGHNALLPLGSAERGAIIEVIVTESTGHSLVAQPVVAAERAHAVNEDAP